MSELRVVRPKGLSDDRRDEISRFLSEHWQRAEQGRASQVDDDYQRWDKNYRGEPAMKERTFPWKGASNLVVPLIRMHLDTFVARTLGIVFGTHPLVKVHGFPQPHADALERYLNYKTLYAWNGYCVGREKLFSGLKNGTSVVKTPWFNLQSTDVMPGDGPEDYTETPVDVYVGPKPELVPFEDFYVYPITATRQDQVKIKNHKIRYVAEDVKEMAESGKWGGQMQLDDGKTVWETLKPCLKLPLDVKRTQEQMDAGVQDPYLEELHVVECYFRYDLGAAYYDLIGLYVPDLGKNGLIDLYFNPYPRNLDIFNIYRPFPRESLFFGESLPQLLEAFQEEASAMHNDRRNNSTIANAPLFKRVNGSMMPNPSTSWYPGKVFDVENADDFNVLEVGRNYDAMLDQEQYLLGLTERLTGIGGGMQASSQGALGKKGVYSAQGTMALMSEGNERQNTAIRDFRESFSADLKTCFILQKTFQPDDPALEYFQPEDRTAIQAALEYATDKRTHLCPFEVRTSTSDANKEVDRQNLMQMAGVLNNYYQQVNQIAQQLANPQLNPSIRIVMNDIVGGMKSIASRLLRAFDEMDPNGVLPDVAAAIEKTVPGGSQGSRPPEGSNGGMPVLPGGPSNPQGPLSRPGLASVLALPGGGPQGPGAPLT